MKKKSRSETSAAPLISIVIPIYNEELILENSINELLPSLEEFRWTYEILLCENGSSDSTVAIAKRLAEQHDAVRTLSIGEPNYGLALRKGILESRGTYIMCDEIDLLDTAFYQAALELLENKACDMVVGSKMLMASEDHRPFIRHAGTFVINQLLKTLLGFQGTDTHGMKALRRDSILEIIEKCITDKDIFASEMVIRSERKGLNVLEIPVAIKEKRAPSINLFRRVPNVLLHIVRLFVAIKLRGK